MRLSSLSDYAVVLMCAAARHCGHSRTSAAELAGETGLPVPTAQKLVSMLGRAGLIRSMRGAGGGVQLARPAASISLAEIIEAIEGPIAMTSCVDTGRHDCSLEKSCQVRPHWRVVNDAVRGALDNVSLASLACSSPASLAPIRPRRGETQGPRLSTPIETEGAIQ